jgi:hypothetical protein
MTIFTPVRTIFVILVGYMECNKSNKSNPDPQLSYLYHADEFQLWINCQIITHFFYPLILNPHTKCKWDERSCSQFWLHKLSQQVKLTIKYITQKHNNMKISKPLCKCLHISKILTETRHRNTCSTAGIKQNEINYSIYTCWVPMETCSTLLYQCVNLSHLLFNQCKFHWMTLAEDFVVPKPN